MNYKLSVLTDDENYKLVDLSTIFKDKKKIYDLESIDEFTMMFETPQALKSELFAKRIITEEDLNKHISIHYGVEIEREIEVLYSSNRETVLKLRDFSRKIIKYYAENHRLTNSHRSIIEVFPEFEKMSRNRDFLIKLWNHAHELMKKRVVSNIDESNIFLHALPYGKTLNGEEKLGLYNSLYELFLRIFNHRNKKNDEFKFSYKQFRDFCVFYIDYKHNYLKGKTSKVENNAEEDQIVTSQNGIGIEASDMTNIYPEKFLSSELSPDSFEREINPEDFPPNSSEREAYIRYLKDLKQGAAPDPDSYFAGNSLGKK